MPVDRLALPCVSTIVALRGLFGWWRGCRATTVWIYGQRWPPRAVPSAWHCSYTRACRTVGSRKRRVVPRLAGSARTPPQSHTQKRRNPEWNIHHQLVGPERPSSLAPSLGHRTLFYTVPCLRISRLSGSEREAGRRCRKSVVRICDNIDRDRCTHDSDEGKSVLANSERHRFCLGQFLRVSCWPRSRGTRLSFAVDDTWRASTIGWLLIGVGRALRVGQSGWLGPCCRQWCHQGIPGTSRSSNNPPSRHPWASGMLQAHYRVQMASSWTWSCHGDIQGLFCWHLAVHCNLVESWPQVEGALPDSAHEGVNGCIDAW